MENERTSPEAFENESKSQFLGQFEKGDGLGAVNLNPAGGDSDEVVQRKSVQRAANQSSRVQQHLALQRNVSEALRAGVVQRNVFKDSSKTYGTTDDTKGSFDILDGSTTDSITHSTDTDLPTPWKVLKSTFGEENLEPATLKVTHHDTLDRPRSISAEISSQKLPERKDPITKDVGHIGNDELFLRQGIGESMYDGGHLLGAKILGEESQKAYDLAPQEWNENENSYNNTIENIARKQGVGSIFQYDVNLTYPTNNFSIDQQTLVDRGVLKALDPLKPWNVFIPSRVPGTWHAEAELTSGGNWREIHNKTKDLSLGSEAEVDGADLSLDKRGAFHFSGDGTDRMTFHSQQYVPVDTVDKPKPFGYDIDSSLPDSDSYEEALPGKDAILDNLPPIAEWIETQAGIYLVATKFHKAKKFVSPDYRHPSRIEYSPPNTLGTDLRSVMEGMVNQMISRVGLISTSTVSDFAALDKLRELDMDTIYETVYDKNEEEYNEEMVRIMNLLNPLANTMLRLQEELDSLGNFGAENKDKTDLSWNSEGALQVLWKKAKKYQKRLKSIMGETAEARMNKIHFAGKRLDSLRGTEESKAKELEEQVKLMLKEDIEGSLTGLSKSKISTLVSTRRKSTRKRSRSEMS